MCKILFHFFNPRHLIILTQQTLPHSRFSPNFHMCCNTATLALSALVATPPSHYSPSVSISVPRAIVVSVRPSRNSKFISLVINFLLLLGCSPVELMRQFVIVVLHCDWFVSVAVGFLRFDLLLLLLFLLCIDVLSVLHTGFLLLLFIDVVAIELFHCDGMTWGWIIFCF